MNIQTLLVIGALMLIGAVTLQVNSTLQATTDKNVESTAIMSGLSLAERMINEVRNKQWDVTAGVSLPATNFETQANFGPQTGEAYNTATGINTFGSMNSFHNFARDMWVPDSVPGQASPSGIRFNVKITVNYVNLNDLNTAAATQTCFKKITVKVKSPYLYSMTANTLTLNMIATYQKLFGQVPCN